MALGTMTLALAMVAFVTMLPRETPRAQDAAAAIERYRASLVANPGDAGARVGLKGLIDRADPVPREQDERIRAILRQYPWPGRVSLIQPGEPGQPFVVSGVVRDAGGRPVKGAILSLFQADAGGEYTRTSAMDEPHARLFGFIATGADGRFEATTIRPGGYPGRPDRQGERWRIPAHIHFDVTAEGRSRRSFQMVLTDDPRMTPYWHDWAKQGRHPVVTVTRDVKGVERGVCDITLE